MEAESGSIPANGIAVNERCVWRLSERTEEDARERARISGKSNQIGPCWEGPNLLRYFLSGTFGKVLVIKC